MRPRVDARFVHDETQSHLEEVSHEEGSHAAPSMLQIADHRRYGANPLRFWLVAEVSRDTEQGLGRFGKRPAACRWRAGEPAKLMQFGAPHLHQMSPIGQAEKGPVR